MVGKFDWSHHRPRKKVCPCSPRGPCGPLGPSFASTTRTTPEIEPPLIRK